MTANEIIEHQNLLLANYIAHSQNLEQIADECLKNTLKHVPSDAPEFAKKVQKHRESLEIISMGTSNTSHWKPSGQSSKIPTNISFKIGNNKYILTLNTYDEFELKDSDNQSYQYLVNDNHLSRKMLDLDDQIYDLFEKHLSTSFSIDLIEMRDMRLLTQTPLEAAADEVFKAPLGYLADELINTQDSEIIDELTALGLERLLKTDNFAKNYTSVAAEEFKNRRFYIRDSRHEYMYEQLMPIYNLFNESQQKELKTAMAMNFLWCIHELNFFTLEKLDEQLLDGRIKEHLFWPELTLDMLDMCNTPSEVKDKLQALVLNDALQMTLEELESTPSQELECSLSEEHLAMTL